MIRPRMAVRFSAATHPGMVRANNEDACLPAPPVFVVADGMGGHAQGERASHAVLHAFKALSGREWVASCDITAAVAQAADAVAALEGPGRAPGSTVTGAALSLQSGVPCWLVFNIGDSRTYLLRSGNLRQVTVDHSASSVGHERRNAITRALGAGLSAPVADQWLIRARVADRLLICSDGLSGVLDERRLKAGLTSSADPQAVVGSLLQAALAAGARDNVSLIVVDCHDVVALAGTELDDVTSDTEGGEDTVAWFREDTVPDAKEGDQ